VLRKNMAIGPFAAVDPRLRLVKLAGVRSSVGK
jgi:hypothetical protein